MYVANQMTFLQDLSYLNLTFNSIHAYTKSCSPTHELAVGVGALR